MAAGEDPNVTDVGTYMKEEAHKGLGRWLRERRKEHESGKLSEARLRMLRAVPGLTGFEDSDQ